MTKKPPENRDSLGDLLSKLREDFPEGLHDQRVQSGFISLNTTKNTPLNLPSIEMREAYQRVFQEGGFSLYVRCSETPE